jgi:tRNA1(Val) A37 N6-methylase TrmN6
MRSAGIEPKALREVIQREGKEAWLVLVEGKLGGNRGMTVLPPLYVEKNGELTNEMMEIYGDYKENHGRKI